MFFPKFMVHGVLPLVLLAMSVLSHIVDRVCTCTHILYFHCDAIKSVCLHSLNCLPNKFACGKKTVTDDSGRNTEW